MGNTSSSIQEYTPEQWIQYKEHLKLKQQLADKNITTQPNIIKNNQSTFQQHTPIPTQQSILNNNNRTQIKTVNKNFEMKPTMTHKTQLPKFENTLQDHYSQRMMDNIHIGGKTMVSNIPPLISGEITLVDNQFNNNPFLQQNSKGFIPNNNNRQHIKNNVDVGGNDSKTKFFDELREIEKLEYKPQQILGLQDGYGVIDVKKAYKKLAMRYHPDKGGNAEMFKLITKAYLYLLNELEHQRDNIQLHSDLKAQYQNNDNGYVKIDEKDFDVNYFNKLFAEHKLEDIDNDGGYGDWIKDLPDISNNSGNVFSEKFNVDVFNKVFMELDDNLDDENSDNKIDLYSKVGLNMEPEILPSGTMEYSEIDYKKSNDYTKNNLLNSRTGLQYTDLKKAHTNTRLINPNKVDIKQYKNVEELAKTRETQDFTITNKDRELMELKRTRELEMERERQERLRSRDKQLEIHSNKVNNLLLQGKNSKTIEYKNMTPIQI